MKNTPWLIVGAGAVGLFWACKLKQLGYKVHLVYRSKDPGNKVILNSIIDETQAGLMAYKVKTYKAELLSKTYNKVLFCTKSFDIENAHTEVINNIASNAHIACLCNGVGAQQILQNKLIDSQKLWVGTTSEGMLKTAPNQVTHTGLGDTFFGPWSTTLPDCHFPLADLCVANIHQKILEKLAINACINPITAIFDIYNGDLLNKEFGCLLEALTAELESAFKGEDFVFKKHSQHLTKDIIRDRVHTVAHLTKLNRSSMCEDLRLNRPTEIDFICGFLLNNSEIDLPIQQLLFDAVVYPELREQNKKRLLEII